MGLFKWLFQWALVLALIDFIASPKKALQSVDAVVRTPSPRFFDARKSGRKLTSSIPTESDLEAYRQQGLKTITQIQERNAQNGMTEAQ